MVGLLLDNVWYLMVGFLFENICKRMFLYEENFIK